MFIEFMLFVESCPIYSDIIRLNIIFRGTLSTSKSASFVSSSDCLYSSRILYSTAMRNWKNRLSAGIPRHEFHLE
jgi:hypothetical protein